MPNLIPDTEDILNECRKFCVLCPSFKPNRLNEFEPHLLFCSRGKTTKPLEEFQNNGCKCPECSIFIAYRLSGGSFCMYGKEGKD
jgi:hypothetical protein